MCRNYNIRVKVCQDLFVHRMIHRNSNPSCGGNPFAQPKKRLETGESGEPTLVWRIVIPDGFLGLDVDQDARVSLPGASGGPWPPSGGRLVLRFGFRGVGAFKGSFRTPPQITLPPMNMEPDVGTVLEDHVPFKGTPERQVRRVLQMTVGSLGLDLFRPLSF